MVHRSVLEKPAGLSAWIWTFVEDRFTSWWRRYLWCHEFRLIHGLTVRRGEGLFCHLQYVSASLLSFLLFDKRKSIFFFYILHLIPNKVFFLIGKPLVEQKTRILFFTRFFPIYCKSLPYSDWFLSFFCVWVCVRVRDHQWRIHYVTNVGGIAGIPGRLTTGATKKRNHL